ncbi:Bone morphoproteintic protein 1 [Sparganum proliferum]
MYTASTVKIIPLLLIFGAATSFAASTRALNIDQHAKKRSEEKVHTSGMNVHVEKTSLNPAAAASRTKSTNSIGYAMEREVEDRSANASYLSQLKYGDVTDELASSYSDEKSVLAQTDYGGNILRSPSADDIDAFNESDVHSETDASQVDISENASSGSGRQLQTIPNTETTAEQELQISSQNPLDTEGRAAEDVKQRSRRAVTSRKSHLWPSGIIPYEIEPLFSIYVEILTENIKNDRLYNFDKKDQHEVDSLGEPYDYDSIMHYARNLFAKPGATETQRPRQCCPRPKIGHLSKPSAGDARQMNKLYSCPSCGQTFLDNSATFVSPNAQTSLSSAEAGDGQQKSGISTHALPFHGSAQSSPLQSANSDPLFCRWKIIAASGERIQLTFTHMDMLPPTNLTQSAEHKPAQSSACVSEYVEVRDGYYSGSPVFVVCGGIMQADDGIFSSPGYPNHYPPNRECTWRIEVPVGLSVLLTFYSFDLESGENCPCDYLEIFDGPSVNSPRLSGICGVELPNPIRSTNSTMTVRFVSDAKLQKQGFSARFQKAVACGGYLTADKGTITSPANLITYPPNNKCIWRIEVSAGFSVQLSFDSFELEEHSDCSSNYVEILDGPSDASPVLCKVCGSSLPGPIMSTKNSMTVKFDSDGGLDNNRFTARFKKVVSCVHYIKADEGNISSPDYPNNYPPNSYCIWRIEVPVGFSVLLTFESFDLEEETDCRFDYLEIFDGSSECSPKLRRLFTYAEIGQCTITDRGCEHLCVDIPGGYKCQCNDGYKLLPDEKSCQSIACGEYLRKDKGYIRSPGFPKEYPPNSRCIWRIEVPSGFFVVLKFQRFELEDIFDCPYDYLEIYDGSLDPSSMLRKLCGTLLPEPVNSTTNVMTLKFVTDNAYHKKGFKVRHQIGVPPRNRFRSVGRY